MKLSKKTMLTAAAFMTFLGVSLPAHAGEWKHCSWEGDSCSVPSDATDEIRYGVGPDHRYHKKTTGELGGSNFICANANFGDPAWGMRKQCFYYKQTEVWKHCSWEGNYCNVPANATGNVRYGVSPDHRYSKKTTSELGGSNFICANANLGDPAWGMRKQCFYSVME